MEKLIRRASRIERKRKTGEKMEGGRKECVRNSGEKNSEQEGEKSREEK